MALAIVLGLGLLLAGTACNSPAPPVDVTTMPSPPASMRGDAARPRDGGDAASSDAPVDAPVGAEVAPCREAVCCVGPGCPKRPAGAPCQQNDQCDTGSCADGVCCNVACRGACVSCNQADRMGECLPVAAGAPDPHLLCRRDPPESCGQSGVCNGQGGCAKHAPGTICGDSLCAGANTMMPGGECDGEGTCIPGLPVDCTPFLCAGRTCRGSCTEPGHCAAPHVCVSGSCGKRGKGQNCSNNDECSSGFCTDGVCCESACAGRCSTCASPRARGSCLLVPSGTVDPRAARGNAEPGTVCADQGAPSCGTNGRCDGKGGCELYKAGTICAAGRCEAGKNAATGSSLCRAGKCEAPEPRSCAPFAGCDGSRCSTGCSKDADCAAGNVCTNGSCGKRPQGSVCSRDDECATGSCAQGRCCAGACNKPCMACNLEGSLGTCTPVPTGGADPAGTCRNDACNNGCDGNGSCRREKEGTACGATGCDGERTLVTRTCTKDGQCQEKGSPCPAEQSCKENRCVAPTKRPPGDSCVADGDCASNACVGNRCCASSCGASCRTCTAASGWKCVDREEETPCGNDQVCRGGRCTNRCTGGRTACGADCVDLGNDIQHCGACSKKCESGACEKGICLPTCPNNQTRCDGGCYELTKDPRHCGACGTSCGGSTPMCLGGKCSKAPAPPSDPPAGMDGGTKPPVSPPKEPADAGGGKPQPAPDGGAKPAPNMPTAPDAGVKPPVTGK